MGGLVSNVDIAVCGKSADGINIDLGFLRAMHLYSVLSETNTEMLQFCIYIYHCKLWYEHNKSSQKFE